MKADFFFSLHFRSCVQEVTFITVRMPMTVNVSCVTHILMRPSRLFLLSVKFSLYYIAVNNNFVTSFGILWPTFLKLLG